MPIYEEEMDRKFIGEVEDTITFVKDGSITLADGTVIEGKAGDEVKLQKGYNTVVDNASKLIAALIKRHTNYSGALFWEVGSGDVSWSDANPPSPTKSDFKLLNPTFRKAIQLADIAFIDGSNNVTASVTNRIQITVKFLSNEANGPLREFGIFGGGTDAVAGTLGSGLMINRKTHGLIYKTDTIELTRVLRFTF